MDFVYVLVDMPVATVPPLIIELVFDRIEPLFRAFINLGLINSRHIYFYWFVLERAGMGEDNIHIPVCGVERCFNLLFYLLRRLLIVEPGYIQLQSVPFINGISSADDEGFDTFQIIDLTIFSEMQVRKLGFFIYDTAIPMCFEISRYSKGPHLMIAVDTENGDTKPIQFLFALAITMLSIVVHSNITQNNKHIAAMQTAASNTESVASGTSITRQKPTIWWFLI